MQKKIRIRFHDELNDFLKRGKKGKEIQLKLFGRPGLLDVVQSIGVPHPEVGRIQVNRKSKNFTYRVEEGDRIQIWPSHSWIKRKPRFICDVHLGKLARHLRLFGFDVLYRNDYEDKEIFKETKRTGRLVLTRDLGILKDKRVSRGYWPRSMDPKKQFKEILERFKLQTKLQPFRICLECNGKLKAVQKSRILEQLEPLTKKYFEKFYQCSRCKKIYWKGSHFKQLDRIVRRANR